MLLVKVGLWAVWGCHVGFRINRGLGVMHVSSLERWKTVVGSAQRLFSAHIAEQSFRNEGGG